MVKIHVTLQLEQEKCMHYSDPSYDKKKNKLKSKKHKLFAANLTVCFQFETQTHTKKKYYF